MVLNLHLKGVDKSKKVAGYNRVVLLSLGVQVTVPSFIQMHLNSDVKVTWILGMITDMTSSGRSLVLMRTKTEW